MGRHRRRHGLDDLVVEVAVVYRRSYFALFRPAVRREADLERFVKELLPAYRDRDKVHAPADAVDDASAKAD